MPSQARRSRAAGPDTSTTGTRVRARVGAVLLRLARPLSEPFCLISFEIIILDCPLGPSSAGRTERNLSHKSICIAGQMCLPQAAHAVRSLLALGSAPPRRKGPSSATPLHQSQQRGRAAPRMWLAARLVISLITGHAHDGLLLPWMIRALSFSSSSSSSRRTAHGTRSRRAATRIGLAAPEFGIPTYLPFT